MASLLILSALLLGSENTNVKNIIVVDHLPPILTSVANLCDE